jgi:hypothetical protein
MESVTTQGRTTIMARISTTVPTKVYDQLGRLAAMQGRSMSNLTAYVLERYVEEQQQSTISAVTVGKAA